MDSILTSIKKLLGIDEEYTHFDSDVTMHINTVFMILSQLGVRDGQSFSIADKRTTWSDYIGNEDNLEAIKSYIYLKVKLVFDPPLSSAAIEAINKTVSELEWRLNAGTGMNKESTEEIQNG